jgi:hypothetical protein
MSTKDGNAENIGIVLPKATWLVIFEYLAHSYDVCRACGDRTDDTFVLAPVARR